MNRLNAYLKSHVWWRVSIIYAVMVAVFFMPVLSVRQQSVVVNASQSINSSQLVSSKSNEKLAGVPINILAPSLGIDLAITSGNYQNYNNTWTVSDSEANYAISTPLVNNKSGTTLIYGHATNEVFGKLKDLKNQDLVYVKTSKYVFIYKKEYEAIIKPTNTEIFDNIHSGSPKMALLTCDGLWSQNRLLITLTLIEVRAI